jgi:choline dehydrogenase
MARPNLTVLTGALARAIVLDGRRATGVRYAHAGAPRVARARREVILAAGAVHSPVVLMQSGIGPAAHLRSRGIGVAHDLPGVGRNLQDHLAVPVMVACREPVSLVAAQSARQLVRFLLLRRGMLTSNVAEACAFVRTRAELPAPDLELIFAPVPFIDHGLTPPPCHGITIGAVCLQPRSAGTIGLRASEPTAPQIEPGYLSDAGGEDLRVLVEGVTLARRILRAPALARYAGEPLAPGDDVHTDDEIARFVREHAETLYHPVGTCRMGRDAGAVVDPELRVHGLDGLRVVDASVMPVINRGHTMAPVIMIAERAADLIRGRAGAPGAAARARTTPPADVPAEPGAGR